MSPLKLTTKNKTLGGLYDQPGNSNMSGLRNLSNRETDRERKKAMVFE